MIFPKKHNRHRSLNRRVHLKRRKIRGKRRRRKTCAVRHPFRTDQLLPVHPLRHQCLGILLDLINENLEVRIGVHSAHDLGFQIDRLAVSHRRLTVDIGALAVVRRDRQITLRRALLTLIGDVRPLHGRRHEILINTGV